MESRALGLIDDTGFEPTQHASNYIPCVTLTHAAEVARFLSIGLEDLAEIAGTGVCLSHQ